MTAQFYTKSYVAKAGPPRGPRRQVTKTYQRLAALSRTAANSVRVDLVGGITSFKRRISLDALAKAWETSDYGRLFAEIPWADLPADLEKALHRLVGTAKSAADLQVEKLPPNVNENLRFDVSNPALKSFLDRRTGALIHGIQADTQQIVQDAVARSFTEGLTPADVARQIRDSIGLLPRQERQLANYRAGLEAQGLDTERIDSFSENFESRILDFRASMIARNETRRAAQEGQFAVWREGVSQGLIDRESAQKEWVVDGDPCEICDPMDGVRVGLDEPWLVTFPNGEMRSIYSPADTHINCECGAELHFTAEGEEE